MVKNTPKTNIVNRKAENLNKVDRALLKSCLVDLMVYKNWQTEDLGHNDDLLSELLPLLANKHADWVGVNHSRELKGSEVWLKSLCVLKNERHADDDKLDKKVAAKRAALKAEESDENVSEDKPPEKISTPGKKDKAPKGKHDQQ